MTFAEFYEDRYLVQHAQPVCRWFHFVGFLSLCFFPLIVFWLKAWWLLLLLPLPTYFFAFLGHVVVHNLPTTFGRPYWSFLAFWKLIAEMITGRIRSRVPPRP